MAHPARSELDKAFSALERDDGRTGLEAMLRAWRSWPSTRLADLIDALSKETPSPPLTGQGVKALEAEWLERAARCEAIDVRALLEIPWPMHPRQSKARFEAWAKLPADPRVFRFGRALLKTMRHRSNAGVRIHRWWCEAALKANDPEAGAWLAEAREAQEAFGSLSAATYLGSWAVIAPPLLSKYPNPPQPPQESPELVEALQRLEQRVRRPARKQADGTRERLLATVYENPADDGARLVLADWLLEQGDPRGEFIQLQIRDARGQATQKDRKRAAYLARAGGASWLDGLEPDVHWFSRPKPRFERGFAVDVTLGFEELRTVDHPGWAMIEVIRVLPDGKQTLFGNANLASLREVHGLRLPGLKRLTGLRVPLRKVTLVASLDEPIDASPAIETICIVGRATFTEEGALHEPPQEKVVAWLSHAPFWRSLQHLSLGGNVTDLVELWSLGPSLPSSLSSVEVLTGNWDLTLSRDPQGAFSRLHAVFYDPLLPIVSHATGLGPPLAALPADALTEFTCEQKNPIPEWVLTELETALKRQTRLSRNRSKSATR